MNNLIINSITIIFIVITILYSIFNIVLNKALYNYIKNDYEKLNDDYKRSLLYQNIKSKYNKYLIDNALGEINMTSFIEEMSTNFTFKNRGILDRVKSIKNASSTCILLGVLGTFVGLSIMLLSVNTNDMINSLPASINSMQTAFITSICGIVCSMVLNLIISNYDSENILVKLMLRLENILTAEVTHDKSQNIDKFIKDINNNIINISKSIEAIQKLDQISDELNIFNKDFISGIESLKILLDDSHNSISTFDESVRKLDKQFNIINLKFTKLFDKYDNQEDINKEILIDIKETSKNIIETTENQLRIKDFINSLNSNFNIYEKNAEDMLLKLASHQDEIANDHKNILFEEANLNKTIKNLSDIIENLSKELNEKMNTLNTNQINTIENICEEIYEIETLADVDGDDLIND